MWFFAHYHLLHSCEPPGTLIMLGSVKPTGRVRVVFLSRYHSYMHEVLYNVLNQMCDPAHTLFSKIRTETHTHNDFSFTPLDRNSERMKKKACMNTVTGHRKRQIELYRRQTNTVSFSKFILEIFVQPTTIFDAWSSSQVLYESLGRSGNAGVGAEDQHSLIVPERC